MLPEYSYTKSDSLAQISTPMTETQNFFLGDCFLLAHPVEDRGTSPCQSFSKLVYP